MKLKAFQSAATVCDAVGRVPLHSLTLNPVLARVKPRHVVSMLRYRCLFLVFCMSVAACNITARMSNRQSMCSVMLRHNKKAAGLADMYGCTPLHYLCMRARPTQQQLKLLIHASPRAGPNFLIFGKMHDRWCPYNVVGLPSKMMHLKPYNKTESMCFGSIDG